MQIGFVESFNGRLRAECLNETLFTALAHGGFVLVALWNDYNTVKRHWAAGKYPEIAGEHAWVDTPSTLQSHQTTIRKERDSTSE